MATDLWLHHASTLPEGITYTVTNSRNSSSLPPQHPPCSLMKVKILNNNDSFGYPCFSCAGFATTEIYKFDFSRCLIDAISNAVVLPTLSCAAAIAEDVLRLVLLPDNGFVTDRRSHIIKILVDAPHRTYYDENDRDDDDYDEDEENDFDGYDEDDLDDYDGDDDDEDDLDDGDDIDSVIGESFEEAGPHKKRCKIESVLDMLIARTELKEGEGEKAESKWKESGDHDCVICMEEIESLWGSLKMPCSHVFHDKCLSIWLKYNHVCPLCRFELPFK